MTEPRKLIILGLLYKTDMHGYMLNAHLGINIPISLKKPTAYNILEKLEKEQFVKSTEESRGDRKRNVYSLTAKGKKEYIALLKRQLSEFTPGEYPDLVSLGFLDDIPNAEAIPLLKERLGKIQTFANDFEIPADQKEDKHSGSAFLALEFSKRVMQLEKDFIFEVIQKLEDQDG